MPMYHWIHTHDDDLLERPEPQFMTCRCYLLSKRFLDARYAASRPGWRLEEMRANALGSGNPCIYLF